MLIILFIYKAKIIINDKLAKQHFNNEIVGTNILTIFHFSYQQLLKLFDMKFLYLVFFIFLCSCTTKVTAQIFDNFTDGNFVANPSWAGNTTDWLVNANARLQSNNNIVNSSFYLSTPNTLATTAQWELYVNLAFNPSSTNFIDIYLTASASDLLATTTSGYFVRLGGTSDEISLYRKDAGVAGVKIIDGADGVLNTSNNGLKLKVIRNAANQFTLFRDITATGSSYFTEGAVTDATFTSSGFFGFAIRQSTASFFQKHFFDDIEVKPYTPDITPPVVISATAITNNLVDVLYNEPVENTSSQVAANYVATNNIGNAATATIDANNNALVHLSFATNFPNGTINTLAVSGVQDLAGNVLNNGTATFFFYTPRQFDIVIDELIADPTPQVGLPNSEWIELRNTAAFPINLKGWQIGDASGLSGPLPDFILKPDSFVIVCTGSATAGLTSFGNVLTASNFPSLDNTGELLFIQSNRAQIIHSVQYNVSWYQNELKQGGGWSLEMVDTKNPCSGVSNWRASVNLAGGTPGKKNSVDAINTDATAPKLVRAYSLDSANIILVFDEPLDSLKAATAANFTISDGIGIPASAVTLAPDFTKVKLTLAIAMQRNKVYTITTQLLTDCAGNSIGSQKTARVGIAEVADSLDIVVNEILFNPPSNGFDFVELYNRSNKIIDLSQTYLANRNTVGNISSIAPLSTASYLYFPKDYLVVTENIAWVKSAFITQNPEAFISITSMPSLNDDDGNVIILNAQGKITDEVKYSAKWHFKLLDNVEAVSLERIDVNTASQNADNWHSAASSVNYGTPSYKNSQYRINDAVQGDIKVTPEIVSPDNDGQDDYANIDFSFPEPGYVANITIYDGNGRPVRYLQRNALCGTKGSFRWDGLGDKNQQLATGIYVVLVDVFNLKGKKKLFKMPIVVARRN